ncbi:hypothetical protein [Niabella ginsengisoli]|uniref:Uncharacterized protein n=1 Tax=Niabella ginsengisoli TaxID=522298 RepID=A0ABS9SI82_9BACT|nr:hypothetical protein [Niabella ginsengisoli]MCH5598061.1 hypothetical protein [Niabella ginsengisoli]
MHVAYQTSGNIAVTDEFVTRFLDFAVGFNDIAEINSDKPGQILSEAKNIFPVKNQVR